MPVSSPFPHPSPRGFAAIGGRVVACLVCVVVSLALFASLAEAQPAQVGVRAGPTFAFLNDSAPPFFRTGAGDSISTNMRLDMHGGVYAIIPLGPSFALQGELLYLRTGGHISRFGNASYRAERYQLSYLQGQALGRRSISVPGPLALHVLAGVTLKRLLDGTVRQDIHTFVQTLNEEIDVAAQDLVRRWDVGGLVGMGMSYPIGTAGRIALELRYNRGLRSVFTQDARPSDQQLDAFDDPPPLGPAPPRLRHDILTASIAYTIPLGR